jgi:hypothetical protein
MFFIVLAVIAAVIMIVAVPRIRRKRQARTQARRAMLVAGRLLTRNGDAMNTSISPAPDAAGLLALARLDDDGAPPAVSPPQPAGRQTSHAYRVARTGQPAASQAEATGPEHSQEARQAAPAGLGAG